MPKPSPLLCSEYTCGKLDMGQEGSTHNLFNPDQLHLSWGVS